MRLCSRPGLALTVLLLAIGCARFKEDMSIMHGDRHRTTTVNFAPADVGGSWHLQQGAYLTSLGSTPYYSGVALRFTGGTDFHLLATYMPPVVGAGGYKEGTAPTIQLEQTGQYVVGDGVNADIRTLTISALQTIVTPLTAAGASELNAAGECGHKDWQMAVPVDLSSSTCNHVGITDQMDSAINAISVHGSTLNLWTCVGASCSSWGYGYKS